MGEAGVTAPVQFRANRVQARDSESGAQSLKVAGLPPSKRRCSSSIPLMLYRSLLHFAAVALAAMALTSTSFGNERRFTYSYETNTMPKGGFEIENWVTWSHIGEPGQSHRNVFQFRHEL